MTTPTPPAAVAPPRPPAMSLIAFDRDGNITVPKPGSFRKWKRPLNQVEIHTVDHGGRLTLTRVATLGVLSLGAKKRKVSVVLVTDAGETFTHQVKGRHGEATLAWAVAFNAWREATQGK
jgi:hypothetical protein